MRTTLSMMILLLLAMSVAAGAAVPPMISYQGKLMQPNGAPVPDGTKSMQFAIYDVPTGGTPLWSEINPSVQVKGGLFATMLGSVVNLPANIFDSPDRWFGVKVGTDPEMTPRQRVASSAFAFRAAVAGTVDDGAITTGKLADASITSSKLSDGSVTGGKIAVQAVTTDKLANVAVNTAQIADGAVTSAKIEAQQAWQTPPLLNGWNNHDGGVNSTIGYMKDSLGFVHLKGLIIGGSDGTVAFALPSGYRPLQNINLAYSSRAANAELDIIAIDGTVHVYNPSGWVSLDCIVFKAEQ